MVATRFSAADLKRAVRVAESCGLSISGLEITHEGTIRVLTELPTPANDRRKPNPLDRIL